MAIPAQLRSKTAKAVLDLKKRGHELTGEAAARLLPNGTPRFHNELTTMMSPHGTTVTNIHRAWTMDRRRAIRPPA